MNADKCVEYLQNIFHLSTLESGENGDYELSDNEWGLKFIIKCREHTVFILNQSGAARAKCSIDVDDDVNTVVAEIVAFIGEVIKDSSYNFKYEGSNGILAWPYNCNPNYADYLVRSMNMNPNESEYDYAARKRGLTNSKQIKSGISSISFEKNLNDYSNDPTVTVTYDYDDGRDSDFYQKSIHECINDANNFISKGYRCLIDGLSVDNADAFDSSDSYSMVIKSSRKPIKSGVRSSKEFSDKDPSWEDLMDDSDWDYGNPESYEVRDKDFEVSFKTTNKQEAEEFYNIHPESFYLIEYLEHGDRIIKSKDKDMIKSSDEILSGFDKNKDSLSKLF